jgi:hypothetical protein
MAYGDKNALDELARRLVFAREAALAVKAKQVPQDKVDFGWLLFGDPALTSRLDRVIDIGAIEAFDTVIEQTRHELGKIVTSLQMAPLLSGDTRSQMMENVAERLATSSVQRSTRPAKPSVSTDPRGPVAGATLEKHLYGLTGPLQDLQPYFQQRVLYLALGRLMVELLAAPPTTGISDRVTKDRDKHGDDARKRLALVVAALSETSGSTAGTPAQILIDKPHGLSGKRPKGRVNSSKDAGDEIDRPVPEAAVEPPDRIAKDPTAPEAAIDEEKTALPHKDDHSITSGEAIEEIENREGGGTGANDVPGAEIDRPALEAAIETPSMGGDDDTAPLHAASHELTTELSRSEDPYSSHASDEVNWEEVIFSRMGLKQPGIPSHADTSAVPAVEVARFFTGSANDTEPNSDMRQWSLNHLMHQVGLPNIRIELNGIVTPEPEDGFFDILLRWKLAAQQSTAKIFEKDPDQWVASLPIPDDWARLIAVLKRRRITWGYGPFHAQLYTDMWRPLTLMWDPWLGYSPRQLQCAMLGLAMADYCEARSSGRSTADLAKGSQHAGSFYRILFKPIDMSPAGTPAWLKSRQDGLATVMKQLGPFEVVPVGTPCEQVMIEAAKARWTKQLVDAGVEPAIF